MKKSNENDAKAKPRRDYNILTDTIARTIAPGGFRTSFRGWASNKQYSETLIELCLAHVEKNKTVRAYKREELIELRRPIMQGYAEYIDELSK